MDNFTATADIARRTFVVVDSCNPNSVRTFWIVIGIESAVLALVLIIGVVFMCVNRRRRANLPPRTPRTLSDIELGLRARQENTCSNVEAEQSGGHPIAGENAISNEQSERRRRNNLSIVSSIARFFATGSCVSGSS
ncbi:hypothetical protein GGR58DRAFT_238826 [Xylaria digitata]|nr:hypothetical protein GGR58DRAFT_238826 [Xylaria digitata]